MGESCPEFVKWREEFVSQERGSRVVHYYLEDSSGGSHLAVVGTERSLRHMLYVVSEEFYRTYASEKLVVSSLKWRSRREVVDWLASFLSAKGLIQRSQKYELTCPLGAAVESNGFGNTGGYLCKHANKGFNSDITWSGISWTCGKQLQHYQAFCRNGTTIAAHSFVLVMSEEENRYLAYLEDMYEDKKGQKKVKVRWFHHNQEFACTIPPPSPHPSEVFITPYSQVISVECVDDIATILTPDHYEKCLASLPLSSNSSGIRLCFRQYSKNKFKPFDLRTLRGYFNQSALLCLSTLLEKEVEGSGWGKITKNGGPKRIKFVKQHNRLYASCLGTRIVSRPGRITNYGLAYQKFKHEKLIRRPLSLKFVGPHSQLNPPYKVGEKIELLCQDSGIRGCWFKCTVLQLSHKRLKVGYDDLLNADGSGSLEEWVPAFRPAAPDKLGMRCSNRLTVRPCPTCVRLPDDIVSKTGTAVDVWWNDGWWEGVVVGVDNCRDDNIHVYFPGEDVLLVCQRKNARVSKDWVGNRWVDIEAKPDILSTIPAMNHGTRMTLCSISTKRAESGSSAMSDQEAAALQTNSNGEAKQAETSLNGNSSMHLENEKQTDLGKRPRDESVEENCDEELGGEN
ncbi:hypothetical protein ACMD2_07072 [Ananas comosus]|uniref:BAH domain-containing protein n=1 Tax=Ananas comosus TaxID=4615 RepID=A0A199VU81_ANACO|nr:hypothetical protein ACMD2_07072 [Ananas comosus]